MSRIISVQPLGEGWSVRSDAFDSEMMFLSGAKAEAAARRLAATLAKNGESSGNPHLCPRRPPGRHGDQARAQPRPGGLKPPHPFLPAPSLH